jgi:hypothetical protein
VLPLALVHLRGRKRRAAAVITSNVHNEEGAVSAIEAIAWGDVPPELRAEEQDRLLAWIRDVLMPGWPVPCEPLTAHACFPHHADVVVGLRSAASVYQMEFYPDGGDATGPSPAKLTGMLEWEQALSRAAERWTASFRLCPDKPLHHVAAAALDGPEASEADLWAANVMQMAASAWNRTAPAPERAREPWEEVKAAADYERNPAAILAANTAAHDRDERSPDAGDPARPEIGES